MIDKIEGKACSASSGCAFSPNVKVVLGEGPVPTKVMIIGEAPTPMARDIGRPFPINTDSGRVLQKWLSYIELERDNVYITNLVKCPKCESTWQQQIHACLPWLGHEMGIVTPRLVVALGSYTHKCFTTEYRPKNYCPSPDSSLYQVWTHYPSSGDWKEYKGIIYFALVHPSNAVRTGIDIPEYLRPHLDRLRELVKTICL